MALPNFHLMAAHRIRRYKQRPHPCHRLPARFRAAGGRTFDTIRQAAVGMPAIMIRQLDALAKIIETKPLT